MNWHPAVMAATVAGLRAAFNTSIGRLERALEAELPIKRRVRTDRQKSRAVVRRSLRVLRWRKRR